MEDQTDSRVSSDASKRYDKLRYTELRASIGRINIHGVVMTTYSDTPPSVTDPGWFPDPQEIHDLRYFNGTDWTDHVTHTGPFPCSGCHPMTEPAAPREADRRLEISSLRAKRPGEASIDRRRRPRREEDRERRQEFGN